MFQSWFQSWFQYFLIQKSRVYTTVILGVSLKYIIIFISRPANGIKHKQRASQLAAIQRFISPSILEFLLSKKLSSFFKEFLRIYKSEYTSVYGKDPCHRLEQEPLK